jgi:hypothetical protein
MISRGSEDGLGGVTASNIEAVHKAKPQVAVVRTWGSVEGRECSLKGQSVTWVVF